MKFWSTVRWGGTAILAVSLALAALATHNHAGPESPGNSAGEQGLTLH